MKVLIVSKSDASGGAYIAAHRLHEGLRRTGIDSNMLVDYKLSDDPDVYGPNSEVGRGWSKLRSFTDRLPLKRYEPQTADFHPAWIGKQLAEHDLVKSADIINLHWVTAGFLSIKGIAQLAKLGKPIVWTLHDMWAFTGGCHYSAGCVKYRTQCGACPQLNSDRARDLSYKVFKKKSRYFRDMNVEIVVLCRWMQDCVKESFLLSEKPVHLIPNGIDTSVFKPVEKTTARDILNLPLDKKIVLFGGIGGTSSERKGFRYLAEAVDILSNTGDFDNERLCIAVFGASHSSDTEDFPFEVRYLGRLHDAYSLALSYNAADVFVAPSLEDNLPNTVVESLACGTPVVAFNIGGMPDMIEHKVNGYLSEPKGPDSLADGIKWGLDDDDGIPELREASREKALREYALEVQARRYEALFDSLT